MGEAVYDIPNRVLILPGVVCLASAAAAYSLLEDVSVVDKSCCLWVMIWLALGLATTVFNTSLHSISHGKGDGCGVVGIAIHFTMLLPDWV